MSRGPVAVYPRRKDPGTRLIEETHASSLTSVIINAIIHVSHVCIVMLLDGNAAVRYGSYTYVCMVKLVLRTTVSLFCIG